MTPTTNRTEGEGGRSNGSGRPGSGFDSEQHLGEHASTKKVLHSFRYIRRVDGTRISHGRGVMEH